MKLKSVKIRIGGKKCLFNHVKIDVCRKSLTNYKITCCSCLKTNTQSNANMFWILIRPVTSWMACVSLQYFLYLIWYTTMSIFGHFNNFFFAAHMLDIAMGFKTVRTILSSVTHNGKQVRPSAGRGRQSAAKKPAAAAHVAEPPALGSSFPRPSAPPPIWEGFELIKE